MPGSKVDFLWSVSHFSCLKAHIVSPLFLFSGDSLFHSTVILRDFNGFISSLCGSIIMGFCCSIIMGFFLTSFIDLHFDRCSDLGKALMGDSFSFWKLFGKFPGWESLLRSWCFLSLLLLNSLDSLNTGIIWFLPNWGEFFDKGTIWIAFSKEKKEIFLMRMLICKGKKIT